MSALHSKNCLSRLATAASEQIVGRWNATKPKHGPSSDAGHRPPCHTFGPAAVSCPNSSGHRINPSCLLRQSNGTGHTLAVFLVTGDRSDCPVGRPTERRKLRFKSAAPSHYSSVCLTLLLVARGAGRPTTTGLLLCLCVTERPISDETTLEDGKSAVRDRRPVPMDQPAVTLARPMRPPLIFLPAHVSILVGWYTRHLESGRPNEPHRAPTND